MFWVPSLGYVYSSLITNYFINPGSRVSTGSGNHIIYSMKSPKFDIEPMRYT